MRLETQIVETIDGIKLFVRDYSPDREHPIQTLYWVHGIGEHGGRHEHVAAEVTRRGWRMVVTDQRGHGLSSGIRTHIVRFQQYVEDIACVWAKLGLHAISPVLLGHSMGGLVAIRAVQTGLVTPSALVISSPLLGLKLHVNPLTVLIGRALVRFFPTSRFSNGIDSSNMTRDSQFAAQRRSDKLIDKTVTAGWFFAMRAALSEAQRDAAKISLPVIAFQGALDRTTDPAAMREWWSRITSTKKRLVVLENNVHELFFEPDWKETTDRMLDWLTEECLTDYTSHASCESEEQQ